MTLSRRTIAAVGVAGVLAAGATIPALAQDGTDDTATTQDDVTTREELRAEHEQAFADALADQLDLDADTVASAIDAVREEMQATRQAEMQARIQARLDELVASGDLTQEEADTLADIQERGVLRGEFGGRFGGPGGHRGPGGGFGGPMGGMSAPDTTDTAA